MGDGEIDPMSDHECSNMPCMAVTFPGPFKHHDVVVHGHAVPFLTATPKEDGSIALHLDRRFVVDLDPDEVERVVPFLADCMAVALGHSCHPCSEVPEPPPRKAAVRVHSFV
jgi:hypothetical protein